MHNNTSFTVCVCHYVTACVTPSQSCRQLLSHLPLPASLMKKQIDNLTTMLETRTLHLTAMVESLTQHIAVERGAATPSVPLREEGDADLVFEWSDIEADDKGDDRSEEI